LSSPFDHIFEHKRILVCVGSGGVGKTTTAAALALRAALDGRRTLVLTIDPAKRLANSLGLDALGHDVQRVPDTLLDQASAASGLKRRVGGELHAMMLDQKRAFDAIVAAHANDPEAVQRVIDNPVYAQISGSLAGAQEYAAMATLHEFDKKGEFEVVIVDTPPTAHALDFLDAPDKLSKAIDSPAIEWFRKLRNRKGSGWSVVGRTGGIVLKQLSKFIGSDFIDDLAVFFTEFNDVLGGFHQRAEETFSILRKPHVGFVLVASPEVMAVQEALFFFDRLRELSMPFSAFVVNKVHDDLPIESDLDEIERKLADEPAVDALGFQPTSIHLAATDLLSSHQDLQVLAEADQGSLSTLRAADSAVVEVPFFKRDIYSIDRLALLSGFLFGAADAGL
jgi:anion-transporting  ArsA/GET3 family ATPase